MIRAGMKLRSASKWLMRVCPNRRTSNFLPLSYRSGERWLNEQQNAAIFRKLVEDYQLYKLRKC